MFLSSDDIASSRPSSSASRHGLQSKARRRLSESSSADYMDIDEFSDNEPILQRENESLKTTPLLLAGRTWIVTQGYDANEDPLEIRDLSNAAALLRNPYPWVSLLPTTAPAIDAIFSTIVVSVSDSSPSQYPVLAAARTSATGPVKLPPRILPGIDYPKPFRTLQANNQALHGPRTDLETLSTRLDPEGHPEWNVQTISTGGDLETNNIDHPSISSTPLLLPVFSWSALSPKPS